MTGKQVFKVLLGKLCAKICRYDRQYLGGKWFTREYSYVGWQWVIRSCRLGRKENRCPWPVSESSRVVGAQNISFDPDDLNMFQHFGCYFQAKGKITIGKGTQIAPNVGIITANHDLCEPQKHQSPRDVTIGENCWIGMNAMILPGVTLGPNTVVGAGAVVTRSFPEGHCVIAGNPAAVIKKTEEVQ